LCGPRIPGGLGRWPPRGVVGSEVLGRPC
jgi:hypothetical protein